MAYNVEVSSLSKEYIRVPVVALEAGEAVNPTPNTVDMAFTTGEPAGGDWDPAGWEINANTSPDSYFARILIGPGSTVGALADGTYKIWVRVNGTPETPVMFAGYLVVT